MKNLIASVVSAMVLATLCVGMPTESEPDVWFSTSVHPYGPPDSRVRRDTERPLNPNHVPSSVCRNMTPSHGNSQPQLEESPYTVTTDTNEVTTSGELTMTVSGSKPFKGIYCQARFGETPVGAYQPHDNTAVVISDCEPGTDNAVSYVSRQELSTISLKWKAPDTPGKVQFRCTIVKSFSEFWVGQKSGEINVVST